MSHPETRRDATVEQLHGREIADPYRWLEDPDSAETGAWVAAQNAASRAHLDALASREWFQATMSAIVAMPRAGTPARIGERYLVSRNDGTQQQDQWYVADSLEELRSGGRLLLDPNTFSQDGTASLAWYDESRDGSLLAYQVSEGGSDWTTIRVRDVATGQDLDDVLTKVKFSAATWLPDGSFLYVHFPTEGEGRGTEAAALPAGRLRRHVLGTPQAQDPVVWELPEEPRVIPEPELSHDGRWLVLHFSEGTSEKNRLWAYPVRTEHGTSTLGEPLKVVDETRAAFRFVRSQDDRLLLHTDLDAPLGRVVRVDLSGPAPSGRVDDLELVDVVGESDAALDAITAAADELLTVHLVDAQPRITRHGLDGSELGRVDVTGGSVVALRGKAGRDEVLLGLTSVTSRVTPYRLLLPSGEVAVVDGLAPEAPGGAPAWEPPEVSVERRRATSKDGTEVPYFLVRRADVELDEPRPTLLYGYGGFNIAVLADFRPTFAGWLSAGGVLAIANLRGGSEYGADWHDAGRLHRKQNVFDDFAAVGDHLVADAVTTPAQLALHGGSNGGLLVGATMLQRPDLAAVALPAVGVLDMLRFHLFTIGAAWISDYGSPEDPEMFETLLAYSPLHNVRAGQAYPATLVLTGDHDDRVVPAHSFKFTAELQRAQGGDAPVLARIETSTGHGLGKPASVIAAETADLLAFAAEHTGLVPS
ncbi:prolyl oligopeptidase family serine peptidase [Nocardioides mesophilus]|uniref:prolyl oligopeptidase n=1 Tax=Nocardioides mesophilus TaxID=433659 RepID=A0A7G9RDI6_9ACTN|nr:prolyl oligopeptidase family serine peptidase [Nocardioides mesophilus]QNN53661.1 S9 family peptidase [Nocardioides mesophilus]